jgi:predicted Ser/Thr protein kinase
MSGEVDSAEQSGTDPLADTIGTGAPGTTPPGGSSVEDARLRASVKARLFGKGDGEPVRVGRYRLVDKLGEGGMGLVYAAWDDELERPVAIKILRPDGGGDPKRLLREARSMARLQHPHIAAVYDVGTHDGDVYVAMEQVEGPSLREWMAGDHPWSQRARVLVQAAEGLRAAHEAGVVHRDFKPENVLVGRDGRVRVLDFGLAKVAPRAIGPSDPATDLATTAAGKLMGTPRYMAPEQLRAQEVGPAADQFAFCLTAYEVAYGQRAFEGEVFADVAASVLREAPRRPPPATDVPASLWPVLERGLRRAPEDRHPGMAALLQALGQIDAAVIPPLPVSRPALRDARENARERLASAFAHELLDADELDERLEALEGAADEPMVARLVADLAPRAPAPAQAALVPAVGGAVALADRPGQITTVFSSTERRGHWSPAPYSKLLTVFGSTIIDLREATLPAGALEIRIAAMFGSVEIFVPPGMPVELECMAILGSAEQDDPSRPPEAAGPRVRVTGWVAFGSVEVRERLPGEGGWAARKRRKAAHKALRDAAAKKALPP